MSNNNNLVTFVARIQDGMILVATQDYMNELEEYKNACKALIKNLNKSHTPARCTIEGGSGSKYYIHYIIESNLVYLCICERGYPRKLAFTYLEEVNKEFQVIYSIDDILRFSRPYAAISFDPKMQRIRRTYLDPNTAGNVSKLNNELYEIHNIMSANINEVLQRGEKLDTMETRSSMLLQESKKFQKYAKYINLQQLYRTWAPIVAILFFLTMFIYFRYLR
jgi:vesicle transport protein SEC22